MVELVTHPTTSSSIEFPIFKDSSVQGISSEQLAALIKRQIADESFVLVILDCRSGKDVTPCLKTAQLIGLPSMLLRRLKSGKLSPTSISPLLIDSQKVSQIVLIPDSIEDCNSVSSLIAQTLVQNNFQLSVFQEELEEFARKYPALVQNEKNDDEMSVSNGLNFRLFNDGFNYELKARQEAQFPAKVMPHVFLGNAETARDCELLKKHGINHIINVTNDLPNYFETDADFQYLRIPVDDNYANNLAQYFPDAISFIEKARGEDCSVLVHCLAGISRSVTVCLAYLMFARQSTLDEAFDQLHRQNHSISPNFNFMKSLLNWERQLLKHHHRVSSHSQHRVQYDEDSENGSSMPSSTTSINSSSACSSV